MGKIDIYGHKKKLERYNRRIKEEPDFEEETKKEILRFLDYCSATGLSIQRMNFYLDRLFPIAKRLKKPFKEASRADLEALVAWVERNENWSSETKNIYRVTLKKFYKWLEGNGTEYPEKIAWIRMNNGRKKGMLPEELLDHEDINKMLDAAENPRDKAFISTLTESGCRITEIASLCIKNIGFDEYGATILVDGKTGMRKVRLIQSVHHLSYWLENHPHKDDPNAFVWVTLTGKNKGKSNMNYPAIRRQIQKIAKKAGIKKRVNLHGFRHARATELAKMGLSGAQMAGYLGWTQSTKMAGTYIHLAGKDVDDALLKAYGIKKKDDENGKIKCPRCFKLHNITARFCEGCGMPLNMRAAVELEDKRAEFEKKIEPIMELLKDKEVKEFLAKKIQ